MDPLILSSARRGQRKGAKPLPLRQEKDREKALPLAGLAGFDLSSRIDIGRLQQFSECLDCFEEAVFRILSPFLIGADCIRHVL